MEAIVTALTTGLTTAQGEILDAIAAVVPLAAVVLGAFLAIRYAIKAFKVVA